MTIQQLHDELTELLKTVPPDTTICVYNRYAPGPLELVYPIDEGIILAGWDAEEMGCTIEEYVTLHR